MNAALLEVIRGCAYGTVGGFVAMAATTLYIKHLDKKLIESIEATMNTIDEDVYAGPEDGGFGPAAVVIAIPKPEPGGEEGGLN